MAMQRKYMGWFGWACAMCRAKRWKRRLHPRRPPDADTTSRRGRLRPQDELVVGRAASVGGRGCLTASRSQGLDTATRLIPRVPQHRTGEVPPVMPALAVIATLRE